MPFIGSAMYALQLVLVSKGFLQNIYFSGRQSNLKKALLSALENHQPNKIYVTNTKLHDITKSLSSATIVLDLKKPQKLTQTHAYDVMWSLVHADYVSAKTKTNYSALIPKPFPIDPIILIPYHEGDVVLCNFVIETAKALSKNEHNVTLLRDAKKKWILLAPVYGILSLFSYLSNLNQTNTHKTLSIFSLFPSWIKLHHRLKRADLIFSQLQTLLYIKLLRCNLIWTFDHLDLELATVIKKKNKEVRVLYDCVDYYSSQDVQTQKITELREAKHMKVVDAVFVNSRTLLVKKKNNNKNTIHTYQGFDSTSFLSQKKLSMDEVAILESLKRILYENKKTTLGFVGNIDYRFNFPLLQAVIKQNQQANFVFTESIITTKTEDSSDNILAEVKKLKEWPNVYFVPATKNRTFIKELISLFDIGIIPYKTTIPFVKNSFPMKLFEYFFCGLPVLSTDISELRWYKKYVHISETVRGWSMYIRTFKQKPNHQTKTKMRELSLQHSWSTKTEHILQELQNLK